MKRMNLVLAAVAALLGSTLTGTASAQQAGSFQGGAPVFEAQYGRGGFDHDGFGHGGFRARTLEGRWILDDRDANFGNGQGNRGRGPMAELQLPARINIDQQPNMVKVMDARNRSLEVILLGGKFGRRNHGNDPDYVVGNWNGSTLTVLHQGPRGATITQTFALQNRGRTLVVKTSRGGFNGREIVSTYHRA